ncbi:MAG: transglutaminase domain-containing protein, partial [Candidatus Aenigmatarchaeota archaeon]
QETLGYSNSHIPALQMHRGVCFHKSCVLAGLLRSLKIPARIVGFYEISKEQWKQVCEEMGEFRFEYNNDLIRIGSFPVSLRYIMAYEYPGLEEGSLPYMELLLDYCEGKKLIRLSPDNDRFRKAFNHFWVEVKTEDGWSNWNTTDIQLSFRDQISEHVTKTMLAERVIVPEIRLMNDDNGFSYYFKNSADF